MNERVKEAIGWSTVPYVERERLLREYESGNLAISEATSHGMHFETLKRRLREWRVERITKMPSATLQEDSFPDSTSEDYNGFVVIQGGSFVVISDLEIPDHDPGMLSAVYATGVQHRPETLVINGDLIATDSPSLNRHQSVFRSPDEQPFQASINLASDTIMRLASVYRRIVINSGNHDERIARATGGEVWMGMLMDRVTQRAKDIGSEIIFSRYTYCYHDGPRGITAMIHPENYSVTPVKLGQEIYSTQNGPYYDPRDAEPRSDRCHIIVAHTHIEQRGWSRDGQREVLASGTLRDPVKTKYARLKAGKFPVWNQSFIYCDPDGYFTTLSRRGTNWKSFLGKSSHLCELVS